jgi:hypothetical protein
MILISRRSQVLPAVLPHTPRVDGDHFGWLAPRVRKKRKGSGSAPLPG